jgi:dUTPase
VVDLPSVTLHLADALAESERGERGFGSSGLAGRTA